MLAQIAPPWPLLLAGPGTCGTVRGVSFVNFYPKISRSSRILFGCATLIALGDIALADGNYQRTKDGKTIVWNQAPKPGDVATWTGDRDRDGYASGFGTLTWYTSSPQKGTESKETVYARYFGNMDHGKFDGPVNGHSKGVTGHAVFSQGKRVSRWAAGPVSSWKMPRGTSSAAVPETPKPSGIKVAPYPSPSSYGIADLVRPVPDFDSLREQSNPPADIPEEGPKEANASALNRNIPPGGESKPKLEMDESLRLLTGPPPSLRPEDLALNGEKNSDGTGRLSEKEVVQLADAEVRRRGYDVNQYRRSNAEFDPVDNTWSVIYEQKVGKEMASPQKRLTMAIDDKTRRTAVIPAR